MRIGLALPHYSYSFAGSEEPSFEATLEWARRADALGFDSLWLSDHLFLEIERYGGPAGRHPVLEPLVTLTALARELPRPRLGTLVLCAALRPPAVLANTLAAVDHASGGRLVAGIGAGWFEPEYEAAGLEFPSAGRRIDHLGAVIDELRRWFASGSGILSPRQQGGPPLWVGGKGGPRILELVAQKADGWNTVWVWTPDEHADRVQALGVECERVGRDPATVALSVGLYALAGEDERDLAGRFDRLRAGMPPGVLDGVDLGRWREGRLVGTVEQVAEQAARWAEAGIDELIVCLGALPFAAAALDDLEPLAMAVGARGV